MANYGTTGTTSTTSSTSGSDTGGPGKRGGAVRREGCRRRRPRERHAANAGVTDVDLIAVNANRGDAQTVYMTGVGVGTQGYNDQLMDVVTDAGRGASVFIASEAEAWRMLNTQFMSTFEIAARDVRLRIDLPENLRIDRFSGQQMSGNPALVTPQYLSPNSEMVFFQDLSTVTPSCVNGDTEFTFAVMYRDLATDTEQILEQTYTVDELLAANPNNRLKGRAVFLYAEALKAFNGTRFAIIEPLALYFDRVDGECALGRPPPPQQ